MATCAEASFPILNPFLLLPPPSSLSRPSPSPQHQYLGSDEEGREETVLLLLVNLSSQCGISFSTPPSSSSSGSLSGQQATSSFPVVNALRDDCSLEVWPVR